MADTATLAALTSAVNTLVATQAQAGQKIKSYALSGVVAAPLPPPASQSPMDLFLAQVSRAVALNAQAGSIIKAHAPAPGQMTGRLTLDLVLDTTSDVKWADNPNVVQATAVLNGVKAAIESRVRLPIDVTIMINVGWTRVAGNPMSSGALGQSMWFVDPASQTDIEMAIAKLPLNSLQRVAFNPANLASLWLLLNGQGLQTTFPLMAATGILGWNNPSGLNYLKNNLSGWIGLANTNWDYSIDGSTNMTGGFSLWATIWHEIWEVLGRACGGFFGDLVSWAAAKLRNIVMGVGRRYVATDGTVVIADYNQQAGGDYGDLAAGSNEAFNAWTGPGVVPSRSPTLPGSAADWNIITLLLYGLSPETLAAEGIAP